MNLDPELQILLDEAKAMNPNGVHNTDLPLEGIRAYLTTLGKTQGLQDLHCDCIEDLMIPTGASTLPARKYQAKITNKLSPGLIYIHGGGWTIGNLDSHDTFCKLLAIDSGVTVISLDYRLAPEHKFPAAVDDCLSASQQILAEALSFGLIESKIAIGGDSAGGNLAAVVSNILASSNGSTPCFQLLIYPATRVLEVSSTDSRRQLADVAILDRRTIEYFNDMYTGGLTIDTRDHRISPIYSESFRNVPPAHVITAEFDPLRDEGKEYAELLKNKGVDATYKCYQGLMHNFIMQTGRIKSARSAVKDMAEILRKKVI